LLRKAYRLKNKNKFKKTYNNGKTVVCPYFILYYLGNKEPGNSKVAIACGKKIGKAIVRNRIKRVLREACRQNLSQIKDGYNIIFIARAKIKGISYHDVEKNMAVLLKKAGLLKQE
jgi:ribonuclease P protein component